KLRAEFSVPFLNSWVVVLDARGETLASWIGDAAGAGCKQSAAKRFPRSMATLIRQSLQVTESLEELERRWMKDPRNIQKFDNYSCRLPAMHAFARLREVCRQQSMDPRLSAEERNEFRLREFLARSEGRGHELDSGKGRSQFAQEGERLLVELADHLRSADLLSALFGSVYA